MSNFWKKERKWFGQKNKTWKKIGCKKKKEIFGQKKKRKNVWPKSKTERNEYGGKFATVML